MAIDIGDAVFKIKGDSTELEKTIDKVSAAVEKAAAATTTAAQRATERITAAAEKAAAREIAAAERKSAAEARAAERAAAKEESASARAATAAETAARRETAAAERKAAAEIKATEKAKRAQEVAEEKAHAASIRRREQITQAMQSVGQNMRTVGYTVTAMGGAITGAMGMAVKSSIDWESAFAGVRKTVDGTDEQLAAIGQGLRDMAREIPVAATELAGFAEIGGQMGVPRDQLIQFTKTVAILGTTTNIAGEEGAAMIAQFANVAQLDPAKYSNIVAAVVALGNSSNATESDIMMMAQRLAAAGTIAGLSAGEILGISTALAGVGIEAEAGGTAFSKLFIDMANSVQTGGEQLENLAAVAGMSAEQFAQAFSTDPAAAIEAFIQGLASIEHQGGNVFAVMDALGYSEIRMRNALLSSAQAADTLTGSLNTGNEAFKANNAHTTEAEKRYATTASQLQLLKNDMMEMAMAIGEALLPSLRQIVEALRPVVDSVVEWIKAHPELTAAMTKATAAVGVFMAAVGPVIVVVGALVGAIASVVTAVAAVSAAGLGATFAAIGAAIVAVIGTIVAAALWLWNNWEYVGGALTKTWNWIADTFWYVFGPVIEAIKGMMGFGISAGGVSGPQMPGMATGGVVQKSGWAMVGERGPELVQMPQGATVYDAGQTDRVINGAGTGAQPGQSVTVNFNRDSVRSDEDIRFIERAITRIIGSGITANGTRALA